MYLFESLLLSELLLSNLKQRVACFLSRSFDHLSKETVFAVFSLLSDALISFIFSQELERMVILDSLSLIHNQNSISVDNSGKSMGDDNHGAVLKCSLKLLLDEVVSLKVDISSGLVKNQDLSLSDQSSS